MFKFIIRKSRNDTWLKNLQVNTHGYLEIYVSSSLRRETDGCLGALHFPGI